MYKVKSLKKVIECLRIKKGLGTHIKLSRAFSKAGRYLTTSQWMSFGGRFTCYYTQLCQIKKEEEDDEIH